MITFFRIVLLIGFTLSNCSLVHSQNTEKKLSLNLNHIKFQQFVIEIESKTPYRFYFDPSVTDTIPITIHAEDKGIHEVLQSALKNTVLKYSIDAEQNIFITFQKQLLVSLPDNFFNPAKQTNETEDISVLINQDIPTSKRKRNTNEIRLFEIGRSDGTDTKKAVLEGFIKEAKSGEPVPGASVYIENSSIGTTTNPFGYYSLNLPGGRHEMRIKSIGLKETRRQLFIHSSGRLDVELEEEITSLKEVVITAEKDRNIKGLQMGLNKLDIKTIKQVPTAFGEGDVLRVVLTLPGVKSVGEGSTGMNVRGGSADQNLILFNSATIYNPSYEVDPLLRTSIIQY